MSSKITALTADTAPTSDDLVATVNDPLGVPANRKVTLGDAITKASGLASGIVKSTAGALSAVTAPTGAIVGDTDTQTITNKNLTSGTNTFPTLNQDTTGKSAKTDALNSATTVVNVSAATAPTNGQILTATSGTTATWQTPASGSGQTIVTKIVAPSGGDYTTLSAAIGAAATGWAIRIQPGTYTEAGVTAGALSNISIVADDPYGTVLNFSTNNLLLGSISNLTMSGIALNFTTGYMVATGSYAMVRNCRITRTSNNNTNYMNIGGAYGQVLDNYINYQGSSTSLGFLNFNTGPMVISNNVFEVAPAFDNSGNLGTIRITGSFISFNNNQLSTLSNLTKTLLSVEGNNSQVIGNAFTDAFGNANCNRLMCITGTYSTISGNTFNGGLTAIHIAGAGADNAIGDNQFNSTKIAINTAATTNARNTITGNAIWGSGTAVTGSIGISATGNNCTIVGNSVQNHKDGIIIQTGATKNNVSANVVLNNGTNFTDSGTSTEAAGANITA